MTVEEMNNETVETEEREWPTLKELMADVGGLDGRPWIEDAPAVKDVAAAVLRQLRRVEMRHQAIREALEAMSFDFQWEGDDLAVEREAGIDELEQAGGLIDELRESLLKWFQAFGRARLLELDDETMIVVKTLAAKTLTHPMALGAQVETIVRAAVHALAEFDNADEIIALAEQRHRLAWGREHSSNFLTRDRNCWPWVDATGQPWPSVAAELKSRQRAPADDDDGRETVDTDSEPEDAVEDAPAGAPVEGCDANNLIYDDAPPKIAEFRRHSGWAEGRDLARVRILIPEVDSCGDISGDADQIYERNLIAPFGLIERLVVGVDRLCDELDSGGIVELEDAGDGQDADVETSGSAAQGNVQPSLETNRA
jgi:hypothetical protein